jgi:hypothetical protein
MLELLLVSFYAGMTLFFSFFLIKTREINQIVVFLTKNMGHVSYKNPRRTLEGALAFLILIYSIHITSWWSREIRSRDQLTIGIPYAVFSCSRDNSASRLINFIKPRSWQPKYILNIL